MANAQATLKDYFQRELHTLRADAKVFGDAHPGLARALSLHQGASEDPQVELLLQSFAWLTGRLRHELEQDKAALPNALLSYLQPHLEAPAPCMTVARIEVKPDGANFAKGASLARGRIFRAEARDELGNAVTCRLRVTQDTPLWPIQAQDAQLRGAGDLDVNDLPAEVYGVLSVRLAADPSLSLKALNPRRLRFQIDENDPEAWRIYDLLALHLSGLRLQCNGRELARLGADALRWLGFADDQAALPDTPHSHPGYRLLQEYFAFPAKFLFFEVDGLDFSASEGDCQLLFLFDLPPAKDCVPGGEILGLNRVPLINLYPARLEPLALDHSRYEYRLQGDLRAHRHTEVHSVEQLIASRHGQPPRALAPWFALEQFDAPRDQGYYYALRREPSPLGDIAGTELYVSFLDAGGDDHVPEDEVVGGRIQCTNRRLPEQLRIGYPLQLEGAGPVESARVAAKATAHHTPDYIGARPWALAGQLSLNHLSLADGPSALHTFKDLLRQHVGPAGARGLKQIDSLQRLACRPVTRHIGRDLGLAIEGGNLMDAWRGFVPGLHVQLEFDFRAFDQGSAALFAAVLHRFLALYAAVNTVVEVSLHSAEQNEALQGWRHPRADEARLERQPPVKRWPPLAGEQPVL